jgi:SAM-dependent methyltransferase
MSIKFYDFTFCNLRSSNVVCIAILLKCTIILINMSNPNMLQVGPDNTYLNDMLHNGDEEGKGWAFNAGDPEVWRYSDLLLKPGGHLLDIGIGEGRGSMYFAMNGMRVLGVDNNRLMLDELAKMIDQISGTMSLPIDLAYADVVNGPFPDIEFDTVLLSYMFHAPSRAAYLKIIEKAYAALKPGGHLFVKMIGKEDSDYEEAGYTGPFGYGGGVKVIDRDTVEKYCGCSGVMKLEPIVFIDPLDVHSKIALLGGKVLYGQTITADEKLNVMFGEDFGRDMTHKRGGMITVIAQKPNEAA